MPFTSLAKEEMARLLVGDVEDRAMSLKIEKMERIGAG
jgi:hypothetical protein